MIWRNSEKFSLQLYFQIEQDVGLETVRLLAVTDLFDKIIDEPFFDQIR